jgi:hypothetical protein
MYYDDGIRANIGLASASLVPSASGVGTCSIIDVDVSITQ